MYTQIYFAKSFGLFGEVGNKSPLRLSLKTPFTKIENKSYHENLVLKHNSWSLGKSQINKNTAYVNKTYIHFVTYIAFFILLHKYTNKIHSEPFSRYSWKLSFALFSVYVVNNMDATQTAPIGPGSVCSVGFYD